MAEIILVPGKMNHIDKSIKPTWVFVGEAPGKTEERLLEPFVGKSGLLLNKTLSEAGLYYYYLTNAVKVRPTKPDGSTRPPTRAELVSWSKLLFAELEPILDASPHPKLVAVGASAAFALEHLGFYFSRIKHPAYALRFNKIEAFQQSVKALVRSAE